MRQPVINGANDMTAKIFTASQLSQLTAGYATITRVDPCAPTYRKLCDLLDKMTDAQLSQVASAGIKFVSSLAINRCVRRGVAL
jgi:hypothetical protein